MKCPYCNVSDSDKSTFDIIIKDKIIYDSEIRPKSSLKVRVIVCYKCNSFLGLYENDFYNRTKEKVLNDFKQKYDNLLKEYRKQLGNINNAYSKLEPKNNKNSEPQSRETLKQKKAQPKKEEQSQVDEVELTDQVEESKKEKHFPTKKGNNIDIIDAGKIKRVKDIE